MVPGGQRSPTCLTSRPTATPSRSSGWALEPGDAVFFHLLTLHAAGVSVPAAARALSCACLGDDASHAPRHWRTSPPFDGLDDELPAGAAMDHPLFPVVLGAR